MTALPTMLLGVAGGGALLLLFLLVRNSRRRVHDLPAVDWQLRAESAERRAEQAETAVKAGLLPHLARMLRANLVTRLLSQRRHLVEHHQEGARRAEALEERLVSAHAGLQEKLRRYEDQLERVERAKQASDHLASPAPPPPAPTAAPPRRNPLIQRATPPPAPVRFSEILARKQSETKPASPNRLGGKASDQGEGGTEQD